MSRYIILCFLLLSLIMTNQAFAGFVVNGGFETGDFTGWTLKGDPSQNVVDTGFSHSGLYSAALGQAGSLASLSQSINTTAGITYTLSFWFAGDGDTPSEFIASIGGTQLLDLVNPPLDTSYQKYTYNFIATSTSTLLKFEFRDDVFFMALDDVDVVPAIVPEPMSMISLGASAVILGGFFLYRKMRSR